MTLPITFANLNTPVPLAYLDTCLQYLDRSFNASYLPSLAALRTLTVASKSPAFVNGYASVGDGGDGLFYCSLTDTTTADNNCTVVAGADGVRWYRYYNCPPSAAWSGYVANASPSTHASAVAGQGAVNVAAINSAAVASWQNLNYPPNVAGGGYGGQVRIPGGYGELAGSLPLIINPANVLAGDGKHITFLCCQTGYAPSAVMADGNTIYFGAAYFDVTGAIGAAVPGYPTGIRDLSIIGASNSGSAIVVNSNTAFLRDLWLSGFSSGVTLQNINTQMTDVALEQNSTGLTVGFGAAGNIGKGLILSANTIGMTVANRPPLSIATSASNTGGVSPVVVVAASQGLNTGYTFNGTPVAASVFDGYQVTVLSGTGRGQTGVVKSGGTVLNGSWQFVLTLTSGSGSWTALDNTSKVLLFNTNMENSFTGVSSVSNSYGIINCVGAYGLRVKGTVSQIGTIPSNGAVYVANSEDVLVDMDAKAALDYRSASTTANGVIIGPNNKNIRIKGQFSGWANGIFQGSQSLPNLVTDGLYLDEVICTGNSAYGVTLADSLKTVITGGLFANNGSSGTAGIGLNLTVGQANASITVAGALADSFVNGAAGYQSTGVYLNVTNAAATINAAFTSINHATSDITKAGMTGRIHVTAVTTSGATNMGLPSTTQVNNYCYANGASTGNTAGGVANLTNGGGTSQQITTVTAGTLVSVLNLTGAGEFSYLAAGNANSTVRTTRMQVIVDGVTVFDATSGSSGTLGNGVIAAGWFTTGGGYGGDPIRFNSSIQVNVCSNVSTDTNGLYVVYTYNKTAS